MHVLGSVDFYKMSQIIFRKGKRCKNRVYRINNFSTGTAGSGGFSSVSKKCGSILGK